MSDLDIRALEANFEVWKRERAPHLPNDKAFERYCAEQLLKHNDLSDEEIESGLLGGSDDGGIDAVYFFINRTLILDETEVPEPAITASLILIQAKYQGGFGENAVEGMHTFARDLLDYSKPVEQLTYLNSIARDSISRFREKYDQILGSPHEFYIWFCYATKSDQPANDKVNKRVENLKAFVLSRISAAKVEFRFYGCRELLRVARESASTTLPIQISKHFSTDDGSVVCLVSLKSFAQFLTDERGEIRRGVLEPNVRDYQGSRNPVNSDIRSTLETTDATEFWWLNNGITLLAASCSLAGNKLTVQTPEIVNGLQTSQEIFSFFKENPEKSDDRHVLIRVIVPPEDQTRNRITKATNFQTTVNPVSLHATDQIHFDIEERLKLYGLFYDRRKGHYRNLRKPISQIVSIHDLARAVIAVVLQEPNNSRARPQSLLNKEESYSRIFNNDYNRDLYVTSILIDRQVSDYLKTRDDLPRDERRDIRFYIDMLVACAFTENATPSVQDVASLAQTVISPIPAEILAGCTSTVIDVYRRLGGTDKVAKGTELRQELISDLADFYSAVEDAESDATNQS
jgi:AIPR protein